MFVPRCHMRYSRRHSSRTRSRCCRYRRNRNSAKCENNPFPGDGLIHQRTDLDADGDDCGYKTVHEQFGHRLRCGWLGDPVWGGIRYIPTGTDARALCTAYVRHDKLLPYGIDQVMNLPTMEGRKMPWSDPTGKEATQRGMSKRRKTSSTRTYREVRRITRRYWANK